MLLRFGKDALPKCDFLHRNIDQTMHVANIDILKSCHDSYVSLAEQLDESRQKTMYNIFQIADFHMFEAVREALHQKQCKLQGKLAHKKRKKLDRFCSKGSKTPTTPMDSTERPTKRKCRRFRRHLRQCCMSDTKAHIDCNTDKVGVINLSSHELTPTQTKVLELGPKFCPTPHHLDKHQLSQDVHEGCRRVRLKELHYDENKEADDTVNNIPKFYKKNFYEPEEGRDESLDAYCGIIQGLVSSFTHTQTIRSNLNKDEQTAINELKQLVQNRQIRISAADKGGAVVVQNVKDYLNEASRQLDNDKHYKPVSKDPTQKVAKKTNDILKAFHDDDLIDGNTFNWGILKPHETRPQQFYHLPKVHKTLNNPPGRPIISGVGGPTETLSKIIDHWLRPLVTSLPSYIKDSTHMLQTINKWNTKYGPFNDSVKLVTLDVSSLYTNIPQSEAETAIAYYMQLHPQENIPPFDRVLEAVRHVLSQNFFLFEDKVYQQISGTAMGTPVAPTIANLFMGWLESKLLENCPVSINSEYWKRFIDDIFLLWFGSDEELVNFFNYINSFHPTIKFTMESSSSHIPFLDIKLFMESGFIHTDLFTKPTDAHSYLHFSSCHPRHCLENIPVSQFIRSRRICSDAANFHKNCDRMMKDLARRGYPEGVVARARKKVEAIPRASTMEYKQSQQSDRVPFVIQYNPRNPPLRKWLADHQTILQASQRMCSAMPNVPVVGERKGLTIKNILMPSALPCPQANTTNAGCRQCDRKCVVCKQHLQQTKHFQSFVTKETFTIRQDISCTTSNVIYLMWCGKCQDKQYVGQTENPLKTRFYLHRSHVNQNTGTLVTSHFNLPDHSLADMKCVGIEKVFRQDLSTRLRRETFWRDKLKTLAPFGWNTVTDH
jgi:hypothetical protein